MMRTNHCLLAAVCAATVVAALPAQQGEPKPRSQEPRPAVQNPDTKTAMGRTAHYVALSEMLGADVVLRASAEERREAAEEGEVADRPTADIEDLVVSPRDGKVRWAVIDVGGFLGIGAKPVAVPITALDCQPKDADEARVTLNATEEQLKSLPEFDVDRARKGGLADALRTVEASWEAIGTGTRDAGQRDADQATGARAATMTGTDLFCASMIDDWNVRATDDEFGSVSETVLRFDGNRPIVDSLIVSSGGVAGIGATKYLVPYAAFNLRKHDGEWTWALPKTKAELESAVRYEKPEAGLIDAAVHKRAAEFFGVDPRRPMEHGDKDKGYGKDGDKEHGKGKPDRN